MRRTLTAAALTVLATGCSSSGDTVVVLPPPSTTPAVQGAVSRTELTPLLLQAEDLPDLPERRVYAAADLTTQAPPQLALCRPPAPAAPHEIANVIGTSPRTGAARVFEVLQVYGDDAGARAAYQHAVDEARHCTSYRVSEVTYRLRDVAPVAAGAGVSDLHYRVTTPDVVAGDVRTLAHTGRFVVLVTGYGKPPGGQSLLDYQTGVLRRALARLG